MQAKIFVSEGVRTYGRGIESARMALAIAKAVETRKLLDLWSEERGCLFAEIVKKLRNDNAEGLGAMKPAASYGAVVRALPFEFEGLVYRLESSGEQRMVYQPTKRLIRGAGALETVAPAVVSRKPVGERIQESVTKALAARPDKTAALSEIQDRFASQILDLWDAIHELKGSGKDGTPDDVSEAMASIRMSFTDLYAQTAKLHARLQMLDDKISLF